MLSVSHGQPKLGYLQYKELGMENGEFKHGIFKEKDIHHAFEAVSLIKGEPVRLQWVTYTAYILEL